MAGSDVTAYNWAQGTTAAIVGPARSRVRQVVIYADAAGAFTFKNGSASGAPDDGLLATDGVYVSAFTGSSNQLTIFLS